MPTQLTDEMDAHYNTYGRYFENQEHTYLKIVKEILKSKGEHRRQFGKIFKLARIAFMNEKTPSYHNLFNGTSPYSEKSIAVQQSMLKKLGVVDESGLFTKWFFDEYLRRYEDTYAKRDRLVAIKQDSDYFEDHMVELEYDYTNTMDVIRKTPSMVYHLPPLPIKTLDYFDTRNIQIIKMNHVGGNPVVQLPLSYHYRCNKCGYETDLSFDVKKVSCSDADCSGDLIRVKMQDVVRPAFASRVITDDRNSISIISLSEIPHGEFIGAVFLCKNKADYYLFMIATEEIEPTRSTVTIVPERHAIWQIIDLIDSQHETLLGKHIDGMEWYKASILLAYLANCKGRISTNVMIVGGAGSGKTSTPRLYAATITTQQKVQPMDDLTGPGLRGSTTQIKVGDTTINVPEPGLVVRHKLIVIDELLGSTNPILNSLKTVLVSSTINVEVAGNRTQTPKYATAIATSNTVKAVSLEQNKWMGRWIIEHWDGEVNDFSKQAAHEAMIEEWTSRGLEWHTGLTFPHIDRWPILFFVKDASDELSDSDLDGSDEEIDDLELAKLLYNSDIDDYFNFCGRIQVDWKSQRPRIKDLVNEIRVKDIMQPDKTIDRIHSKRRLGQNIALMLQLSAQINGRANLTNEDFAFVRELWSKTCEWVDVSELSHDSGGKTYPTAEWTVERIKNEIHTHMKTLEGAQKYWMTKRGFSMIAAKLDAGGAPPELVDSTIERYRQSPNQ